MLLLGHRGVRRGKRENTLAAFEVALKSGLDGVEFDVQQTKDGALVVYHDFITPVGLLHERTLAELKAALPDLPTLEEVMAFARRWPRAVFNLELKSVPGFDDGRVKNLARALADWPGSERLLLSSFDPVALLALKEAHPEVKTGFLYLGYDAARIPEALGFEAAHPHRELVGQKRVAELRERGLFVVLWPANTREEAREAVFARPDAVIGGVPEWLLEAKEELGHAEVDEQAGDVADGGDQGV